MFDDGMSAQQKARSFRATAASMSDNERVQKALVNV
jgi:hypothetical protein